ncbi:uncharacterized protein MELLADRAFT_110496 [Melampsora larici-populina 98AG31]|uniref:Uncharacterized protein n=1 Tax=Melampsora larici-populina (strain 98AG31 / pathotype 3-4-7) TaxID=747676 RepID=F4S004_MELLP|nr:uncharacterized protein MELLADRAFT_110496 [Melampsora larici-populina 98AG31]EGG02097.1 hypothetical protein MELLADRAFT_110496 [Melampsora larici-populina 98AG31]
MNINTKFTNEIILLERTYNHYVHFLYGRKYRREVKEDGKNLKDDERKNTLARRRRLMKARALHASQHNFPSRYQKILKATKAHSDDEWSPKLQAYVVKTPVYRSAKAGIFMRRLDHHMKISAEINAVQKAKPRLLVAQRLMIADCDNVALLPNPEMSLLGKTHPDERKNDRKFTEKYWSEATKLYDLDHFKHPEEDEDSESGDSTEKGSSVDLGDTDGEDDEDEDFEEEELEEDIEIEDDLEDEADEEDQGKGKGKAKGKGALFVDDEEMEDDCEDDARAARFDAWNKV